MGERSPGTRLTVVAEARLDRDGEVHRVLTETVVLRQADVGTVVEWVTSLG
jgi:hypothetical protein